MLVDNALNSALYNVWNWNSGMMLLADWVFPFLRLYKSKPDVSRLRHSYFWAEVYISISERVTVNPPPFKKTIPLQFRNTLNARYHIYFFFNVW